MLTDEERIAASRAAWLFRKTNRFPSEILCETRGQPARTLDGAETPESVAAWHEIASAIEMTPTGYMRLLLSAPEEVARNLLRPLSHTPESLGWIEKGKPGGKR